MTAHDHVGLLVAAALFYALGVLLMWIAVVSQMHSRTLAAYSRAALVLAFWPLALLAVLVWLLRDEYERWRDVRARRREM